jgi:hypothetical protein
MPRKKRHESKQCTAKAKQTGMRCRRWAAPGKSTCFIHGGAPGSGGQLGNRHALKHGLYENIRYERLSPEEKALFDRIPNDPPSPLAELKLLRLLLVRLLGRLDTQVVVRTPDGVETVSLEVDEVAKTLATAKIIDQIRKLVRDLNDSEDERFQQLLAAISAPAPDGR